ncbi:hypothetical protein B4N89_44935 [Embleya scabrispora]|uniref:Uncharacterized protein n=1 Tax=Embleya scabrispora TaxID=159449 RepID=A0A1T3NJ61_9ACTN|nr:hypothetical protein [Embleya scabrispora]OPC76641.1 hypothetical protein B4N89_44935 [Embleya scabrispora]
MTDTTASPADPETRVPTYDTWDDVPDPRWMTRTQHADLDMPRKPSPRVVARVWGSDFRGGDTLLDLHDATHSTPTTTGAARLLAADVDRTHTCDTCGAHSERVLAVHPRHGRRRLCPACAKVATIRTAQREAVTRRAAESAWARRVVADPTSAWAHLRYGPRSRTEAGRRRRPPYVLVTAVDHTGATLVRTTIRLASPRSTDEVPNDAVPLDKAARQLTRRLGGRRLIVWRAEDAAAIREWTGDGPAACRYVDGDALAQRLPAWRGVVTRDGTRVPACLSPGRADRLFVATMRMASLPELDDTARAWLTTGPGTARVEVTGDEEFARRVHAVLRAVGIVADDAEPAPTPLRGMPGTVTMAVHCHRDGVTG